MTCSTRTDACLTFVGASVLDKRLMYCSRRLGNTFSDAALYMLTKTRIPGTYNRIERFVTATKPVSISLLNSFLATA